MAEEEPKLVFKTSLEGDALKQFLALKRVSCLEANTEVVRWMVVELSKSKGTANA